jgi:hypothetical protein
MKEQPVEIQITDILNIIKVLYHCGKYWYAWWFSDKIKYSYGN